MNSPSQLHFLARHDAGQPYTLPARFASYAWERIQRSAAYECRAQGLDLHTYADDATQHAVEAAIQAANRTTATLGKRHKTVVRGIQHWIRYATRTAKGYVTSKARSMEKLPKTHPDVVRAAFDAAAVAMQSDAATRLAAHPSADEDAYAAWAAGLDRRTRAIVDRLEAGDNKQQAILNAGLPISTGYRLLAKAAERLQP